jgi:hypothetical protein
MTVSLVTRFWRIQAMSSVFLLMCNLFSVRSGALILDAYSAALWVSDVFLRFRIFPYDLSS